MIVVDNAVLAGFAWPTDAYHAEACRIHAEDPDWHSPELCRSEFRSVSAGVIRKGETLPNALRAAAIADGAAEFHCMDATEVFAVVQESPLSAYDAEFVALARRLGCKLLTTDRLIIEHYPHLAVRLRDFVRAH